MAQNAKSYGEEPQ